MRLPLIALLVLTGCANEVAALPYGSGAEGCGTCHESVVIAWSTSPHAASGTSPVFEALRVRVGEVWGEAAADACIGCHQPGHSSDVGIGCISCHAATGNTGERDGRLRVDPEMPLAGPTGEGTNAAHQIRATGFLTSASLCGTCHQVTGPGLLEEPTLTEYRASDFAAEGVGCADCHMPDGEHRFVGIDPAWGQSRARREDAIDDARALFADAVALEIAVDGDDAVVTIANVGAGHAVPTGAAFLRDIWVEVSFGDGDAPRRVLSLGAELTSSGVTVALITDADAVTARGLSAGERRSARVPIPAGAATVTAQLRLRAIRWDTLDALGLEALQREVPTIDVVAVSAAIW